MENVEALLESEASKSGIQLSSEQTQQFQSYMELLLDWNEKINMTAIKEPHDFAEKHFLDSLLPLKWLGSLSGKKCADVGTGAGFPGLVLKIAEPETNITLLDSLQKRLNVLDDICSKLKLDAKTVHARAEEAGHNDALRGQFDFTFARAVAPLAVLCEYCLPLTKLGGCFCAWKGPAAEEELSSAENALKLLGGKVVKNEVYELPDGSKRTFLMISHERKCSVKYPRTGVKIRKQPL